MKYEELPEQVPLGRSIDLTGQKFNKLTALYRCKNKNRSDRFHQKLKYQLLNLN